MNRIVIVGNSGSGKTFLAKQLGTTHQLPIIHLDELFWLPGGFNRKRPAEETEAMVNARSTETSWIAEGVFGHLAEKFLIHATHLIWLDLPWEICRESLLERGSESSRQADPVTAEENFERLLTWAAAYDERSGDCSRAGHLHLHDHFPGARMRITAREKILDTELAAFLR